MVELYCTPFVELIDRMRWEFRQQQSMFDLPQRKWYLPCQEDSPDLTVQFHDLTAGNASGPASGPQSQMAQNLVLSWLAGGRIMELKTVQVKDDLEIARPCIDATNVGYNIEWSQELRVEESLNQYVQGAMLIHMLRRVPEMFGDPFGDADLSGLTGEPVYDMSIGYDLAGIRSRKVTQFITQMMDATSEVERCRSQLPKHLQKLRELEFPTQLSRSITLSTFHGCPADEIERIGEYLLTEIGVHTIVKMNPPMLGKGRLEHLLHDVMGYHDIKVHQEAYSNGLQFDESVAMTDRLMSLAKTKGLCFGAKFSNTLEVVNHRKFFSPKEQVMYLSGAPLHVITLTLAGEYRSAVGPDVPISFSAGVDRKNFSDLVACGFTPITTCTDLLKVGGYGRLPPYLHALTDSMKQVGAGTTRDFILDRYGNRDVAAGDVMRAAALNLSQLIEQTKNEPRYRQPRNLSIPKRIDSHLTTFDCITCYKCIPVCPNDANFFYETPEVSLVYRDVEVVAGNVQFVGEEKRFEVERQEQIANFGDYCNHCGNCDTFCPEYDGPYLMKPTLFGSRRAYEDALKHDGFLLEQSAAGAAGDVEQAVRLTGRIKGREYRVERTTTHHTFFDGSTRLLITDHGTIELDLSPETPVGSAFVSMGPFYAMRTLLAGLLNPSRIHPVNVPFLED